MTIATQEHLEFLDDLRASGSVNMFGDAKSVLLEWMETFNERHDSNTVEEVYMEAIQP